MTPTVLVVEDEDALATLRFAALSVGLELLLGLAMALALYVASASSTDNVERMIQLVFERGQRAGLSDGIYVERLPRFLQEIGDVFRGESVTDAERGETVDL